MVKTLSNQVLKINANKLKSSTTYMGQEISNLAIKTPLLIQLNDIRNAYPNPTAISEIIAPTENG